MNKQMFFVVWLFVFAAVFYFGCSEGPPQVNLTQYAYVYKSSGDKQCAPNSGSSLENTAGELGDIEIFFQIKGVDGKQRPAECGSPTGRINIYKIARPDVQTAMNKGFAELPEDLLWQVDYEDEAQ